MKHMKKLASFLLALVMVFSLATTAFAADTTITAPAAPVLTMSIRFSPVICPAKSCPM